MAQAAKRPATYADLDALPDGTKAQLVHGTLFVPPRPSMSHQEVVSALGEELRPPFHRGRGGPGGWLILVEPEVRIDGDALAKGRVEPFAAFELDLATLWSSLTKPDDD